MDNSRPLILEISSDEETGFADSREGDFAGDGDGFFMREDNDWLSKLLREVDGDKDDDSDEVLLVSEVKSNPKRPRLTSSKPACEIVCNRGDEDDDDCVILDCDPGRARVVKNGVDNDGGGGGGGDGSDDLEIVGEKGEVACRDFPHARHLCANFAFASTPHDVHCSQCHCYVCDSLAPCVHWGTGISSSDHCHANDKEECWKTERRRAKMGSQPVPALPGTIDTFLPAGLSQTTQVPPLLPPLPNSLLQIRAFRQVPCRPCSKPSNVKVPIANQNRSHPAGRVIPRHKTRPHPQRLHAKWRCDTTSMGNNGNPVNIGPQFICRPALKRPGVFEPPPNSRQDYNRSFSGSQVSIGSPLKRSSGWNKGNNFNHQQNTGQFAANPVHPRQNFPRPQSMKIGSTNYIPPHPQIHSQPNSCHVVGGPMHSRPDMTSQPCVSNNFENGVPYHSQALSPPNLELLKDTAPQLDKIFQPNFPESSQSLLSKQLDSSNDYGKQMHSTPVMPSPPNQSSQFQGFGEHTSLHINHQNTHRSRQAHRIVHTSHAEFGVNWDTSLSHNNVQSARSADNFSVTENDPSTVPACSFNPESVPPADARLFRADKDSHFPVSLDPGPLNYGFDNWVTENPPFPGDSEASPMSPGLTAFSPDPASIDSSGFDF